MPALEFRPFPGLTGPGGPTSVIVLLKMEHPPKKGAARCLSLHAGYLCRHEGACCTAGWAIPVERPVYERLSVHFGAADGRSRLFDTDGSLPDGAAAMLNVQQSGACVFFEADRGNLCAVHRELGAESLPVACRQFPACRPPRRAWNVDLSFALLPDRGGPAPIPSGAGVRDRRRARNDLRSRATSRASTHAERCRLCCGRGC